jgi:hypothetical protein
MSLAERAIDPGLAEDWIREALRLHPQGVRLTVSGTCMEPALAEGSKVTLATVTRAVRAGEVVLVRTVAGLRLHRVLLAFADRIRTKGDRGTYLDPAAPRSAVIAICDTGEGPLVMKTRAFLSLARLAARPWTRNQGAVDRGDRAHARLLA